MYIDLPDDSTVNTEELTCQDKTAKGKVCGAHPGEMGKMWLDYGLTGWAVSVRCGTHVNKSAGDSTERNSAAVANLRNVA